MTTAASARMKLQRAFAQEFLCPWAALDAFTDERGTDDDAIADAADDSLVDELLILSSLVNQRKMPRDRLRDW